MARAIEEYGFPFMSDNATLSSIIDKLETGKFSVAMGHYHLPIAYLLDDRLDDARAFVTKRLESQTGQTHAAALAYRKFADPLLERLGSLHEQR